MNRIIGVFFSKSGNTLEQLELRVLAASVIAVYLNLIAELKKKICKSSIITEADNTRATLSRAAEDVNKLQFIFLLVDPVMGDDGMTYDMYTSGLLTAMKELVARADVITPNLTEFCLLTDIDYNSLQDPSLSIQQLISRFKDAGQTLTKDHEKKVLITGIHFTADDGVHKIGNLLLDGSSHFLSAYPCCNGSYSGTGDLFASCITGGLARDISLTEMMQTAGSFLEKSLIDSVEEHVPVNEGVNFEKYLYLLHT